MLGQFSRLPRFGQAAVHSVHERRVRRLGRHVLLVPGVGRPAGTAAVAMAAALAAVSAGAGTVPVELALGGVKPADEATISATLVAQAGARRVEWEVRVPGRTAVPLEDGVGWRLWAEAPGWWGEPAVVVPELTRGVLVRLLPAGELHACVESAPAVPRAGTARAAPDPQVPAQPAFSFGEAEVVCPIVEGCYRCPLPAGVLDVRLGIEGHAPSYL